MDPVVTARVPAGIKTRGVEVLHEIGSNTSELINAAFEYVIKERQLPRAQSGIPVAVERKTLDPEQRKTLDEFMGSVKTPVPPEWANCSFEELLEQAMETRYAHLR